jgi:hypothetical protein
MEHKNPKIVAACVSAVTQALRCGYILTVGSHQVLVVWGCCTLWYLSIPYFEALLIENSLYRALLVFDVKYRQFCGTNGFI